MVRQITCTTQPTLFLLVSFAPSQAVALKGQGEVSHRVEKKKDPATPNKPSLPRCFDDIFPASLQR